MVRAILVTLCAFAMVSGVSAKGKEHDHGHGDGAMKKSAAVVVDEGTQKTCPIMEGGKIDKSVYIDHDGKRVYFCCAGCESAFLKDPAKYLSAMEKKGEKPAILKVASEPQTKCPVMGGAIDKKVYADHDGKRVYFCCEGCIAEFKKDPAMYLKKMESDGQIPETL